MRRIDLNADLGEGGKEDAVLLSLVTSANIACGGHAGDDETMHRTVELAMKQGVKIGAHPGYEDRENFGRLAMVMPLEKITELVERQIGKLANIAASHGIKLHHAKLHGALYNQSSRDASIAAAAVQGVVNVSPEIIFYALPNSILAKAGVAAALTVWGEGFADRRYRDDGTLMPRTEPGALITDIDTAVRQSIHLAADPAIQTLCVHGDGEKAVQILKAVRNAWDAK